MTINPQQSENDNQNLKEIVEKYLRNWKWFVLSVVLCLLLAFTYLRYAVPKYAAQAKIQILKDQNSGSGIDLFKELNFLSGSTNEVQDEIEIINSYSNFIEVSS